MDGAVDRTHIVCMVRTPIKSRPRQHIFLREWRQHRGYTLEQLAGMIGTTHATLSRIERGQLPYNQGFLERAAEMLMCEPADLLVRNPEDPDGIWSIWERAKPGERRQIVEIAKTLLRTGTERE
ncbi:MAG: helix-turn-helix transcriptional regulator [Methylobacteriaceae bacterium]|nr:helix-turn-helix transcriptional regulator [Methylobacteriaceae bacterium]